MRVKASKPIDCNLYHKCSEAGRECCHRCTHNMNAKFNYFSPYYPYNWYWYPYRITYNDGINDGGHWISTSTTGTYGGQATTSYYNPK